MPAVLAVDVLDHLLAPLVLEVDVDVGRLLALDADEAAEQQAGAARVDLGDVQAVADQRVGGAAAALAQDVLVARPVDDVGDGQEVRLVLQLGDDRELVLDRRAMLVGQAGGKAPGRALVRELAQLRRRRLARRDDLLGVLVLQLGERELAALRDRHRLLEPGRLVERGQAALRAQVLLGVGGERQAALGDGPSEPRGGKRVLQGLARADVHQHIAGGDDRQTGARGDLGDVIDEVVVIGTVQQLDGDRGALLEPGLEPGRVRQDLGLALRRRRHEQGEAVAEAGEHRRIRHLAFDVARVGAVVAFLDPATRDRDPVREVAVAAPRLRQQHQAGVRRAGLGVAETDLAADDQRQLLRLRLDMGAHDAGERALVGDRDCAVAERGGALHQLLGVRRARQEAEVAAAVKLGVAR